MENLDKRKIWYPSVSIVTRGGHESVVLENPQVFYDEKTACEKAMVMKADVYKAVCEMFCVYESLDLGPVAVISRISRANGSSKMEKNV